MNILIDNYYKWLIDMIKCESISVNNYSKLLFHLYNIEFIPIMELDENRALDGINLRYRYCDDIGINENIIDSMLKNRGCSILEMMIALSLRCEEDIMGDPNDIKVSKWFWIMINNLGFTNMTNANFDKQYVDLIIDNFIKRKYKCNGENGGLFIVNNGNDLTKIEIWYQMCWYLNSIIDED